MKELFPQRQRKVTVWSLSGRQPKDSEFSEVSSLKAAYRNVQYVGFDNCWDIWKANVVDHADTTNVDFHHRTLDGDPNYYYGEKLDNPYGTPDVINYDAMGWLAPLTRIPARRVYGPNDILGGMVNQPGPAIATLVANREALGLYVMNINIKGCRVAAKWGSVYHAERFIATGVLAATEGTWNLGYSQSYVSNSGNKDRTFLTLGFVPNT